MIHVVCRPTVLGRYKGGLPADPVNRSGVEIEDRQGEGWEVDSNCMTRKGEGYVC